MKTSTRRKFIKSDSIAGFLTPLLVAVGSPENIVQKLTGAALLNPIKKDLYLAKIKKAIPLPIC